MPPPLATDQVVHGQQVGVAQRRRLATEAAQPLDQPGACNEVRTHLLHRDASPGAEVLSPSDGATPPLADHRADRVLVNPTRPGRSMCRAQADQG